MIRALSLLWTLVLAILVTGVGFYYIRDDSRHGFPFSFATDTYGSDGSIGYHINVFSIALDVLVWWVLFSLVWVIVRNYVLEID